MKKIWIATLAIVLLASSGFSTEEKNKKEGKKELFENKTAKEIVEVIKERREAKYQEVKAEMEKRYNEAMTELEALSQKEDLTKEDIKAFVEKRKRVHKENRKRQGKRHQERKQEGEE